MSRSQTKRWERLLLASFDTGPVFRMGFDQHVRAYRRHIGSEAYLTYHSSPTFASAYEAKVAEQRALPMPAWKESRL